MKDNDMKNMDHMNMKAHDMSHMDHMNMKGHDMSHMDHMNMKGHDMSHMDHMNMHGGDMMMHGGHMMHMGNLKKKFWISFVLMIPILIMSPMMGMKLPFQYINLPWTDYINAILGTILFIYGGMPFFRGAKAELAEKKPAMMTLITMGISVTYIYSIYAVIANDIVHVQKPVTNFFWELSTLIVIMLLGHWLEMDAVMNAGSALSSLAKLLPDTAHMVMGEKIHDIKVEQLKIGDIVQVRAGEKIPADGKIISGTTSVNESMVTGESKAVSKAPGNEVVGGSINGSGTFEMKVTGTGNTGYLAKVMRLVNNAQNEKSDQQNFADKVAGWLFYAAVGIALIAFIVWMAISNFDTALPIAVTVLVIACPHALGLAIPLVISRSTALAAKNGLLIRNRNATEHVSKIRYALMDKTGTLTKGNFAVTDYQSLNDKVTNNEVLQIMASLENGSNHPLAIGILNEAKKAKLALIKATDVKQITGMGLSGTIDDKKYVIVSPAYLDKNKINYDQAQYQTLAGSAKTISYLVADNQVLGLVAEGDQIKPNAKAMVSELKKRHIESVMLTGDNKFNAQVVAKELGITEFHAQLMPEDKEKIVKEYQTKGAVMFIGDGVNDAPSLARADLGIAIGSGTDVAIDSADVVLVKSDLSDVIKFLNLARHTNDKMVENLWWGAGYNIIALPLAAGILAPIGFMLNPMVGALVMSLSTIIVAINAMTLHI